MEQLRWKQRLENLSNAKLKFDSVLKALQEKPDDEFLELALIQCFEFTYELSWKTLKDYLKHEGFEEINTPRQIFKQAFQAEILQDGDVWINMLENRNMLAHTYNELFAKKAIQLIQEAYSPAIKSLYQFFSGKA